MRAREEQAEARYRSAGVAGAAPLVARDPARASLARRVGRAVASWFKTAALTLGAMYLIGWAVITAVVPAWYRNAWHPTTQFVAPTVQRVISNAPVRQFVVPVDPSITPEQAGAAFQRMQPVPTVRSEVFPQRLDEPKAVVPWRTEPMPEGLFGKPWNSWNGPDSRDILKRAAAGLTPAEREFLRGIATAPVWRDFETVARAAKVDYIAARYELPFRDAARIWAMPILPFAASKELAYAGVARAAWHLAEGRRDSAEFVLREVVSFGYVIEDNMAFSIDLMIGNVITSIGRDGLSQLFAVTRDPRGAELADEMVKASAYGVPGVLAQVGRVEYDDSRDAITAALQSSKLPRQARLDMLRSLEDLSCGSMKSFVGGGGKPLADAYDYARSNIARFPSERALLDLMQRSYAQPFDDHAIPGLEVPLRVGVVLGKIYFNPRLVRCVVTAGNMGPF
jgi:hypothetical protein